MDYDVLVIGGGPAGMMAALTCGDRKVCLLEKNDHLGKKLRISGKGRCNLTNTKERREFFEAIRANPKFFYSAYAGLKPEQLIAFFEKRGLPMKVERGDRVFPESDSAQDVVDVLTDVLKEKGVDVRTKAEVSELLPIERGYEVRLKNGRSYKAESVVLASGGASYPGTGSTGDGYVMAESLGLKLTPPRPALVPLISKNPWVRKLQGLTLKNIELLIAFPDRKKKERYFGDLLFTHFGISGPIVLTASDACSAYWQKFHDPLQASLDLKPALSEDALDKRILREIRAKPNGQLVSVVRTLLPRRMVDLFLEQFALDGSQRVNQLSQEDRRAIVAGLKSWPLRLEGTRPIAEAIVTAGGVSVKEIDPKTMMVKSRPGLYICGELLDLHADTGGYNLQIAFSTGAQAGLSIAQRKEDGDA